MSESYVYFIEADLLKIGVSRSPMKRLQSLRTGAGCDLRMLGVVRGGIEEERAWHRRFASKRTVGEWFRSDDELRSAISEAVTAAAIRVDLIVGTRPSNSLVEAFAPAARRVELFARESRSGWATWGNEATRFDAPEQVAAE